MLILNADGGCNPNPGPATFGVVAKVNGKVICRMRKRIGQATNNIAEWRGALAALDFALVQGRRYPSVELRMDSQLVVHQLNGRWRVKHEGLQPLAAEGKAMLARLRSFGVQVRVQWVPRRENAAADALT